MSESGAGGYIAECFWPDVDQAQVDLAAARVRSTAEELTRGGRPVELTDTILVGKDEVVFYVFDSASGEAVREACELAAIPFERIVASVHIKERLQ